MRYAILPFSSQELANKNFSAISTENISTNTTYSNILMWSSFSNNFRKRS